MFTDNSVDPGSRTKRQRRAFTADYKLNIIVLAKYCKRGEIGPLLARENLSYSHLQLWRRQLEQGGFEALSKTRPGPPKSSRRHIVAE